MTAGPHEDLTSSRGSSTTKPFFCCSGHGMSVSIREVHVKSILTRTTGYLRTVCSHSLQPYRGCTYGNSLCGVGCYVQHNPFLLRGQAWGSFLDARVNAAEVYRQSCQREARWARRNQGCFSIFCSSSTDPFVPQEQRYQVTRRLLETMQESPPDRLIVQTHSDQVVRELDSLARLNSCCDLRVHVSIETDRESLPGLPPHGCSVDRRFQACQSLKEAGIFTVVTVAPLLPISDPDTFFGQIASVSDAVILDHFIGGDGSRGGQRTNKTLLPSRMAQIEPESVESSYLHAMIDVAKKHSSKVGVGMEGFSGRYL